MTSAEHLGDVLFAQVTANWAKAAMVVARAMAQRPGVDDAVFHAQLKSLVAAGIIEANGNLDDLRHSEVRLRPRVSDV